MTLPSLQSKPVHTVLYYVFMEQLSLPRLKGSWNSFYDTIKTKKKTYKFLLNSAY